MLASNVKIEFVSESESQAFPTFFFGASESHRAIPTSCYKPTTIVSLHMHKFLRGALKDACPSYRTYSIMNRPRNRQGRPPRNNVTRGKTYNGGLQNHVSDNVPTTQQVLPGAHVSIVLKADQSNGQETQGVVRDLLTRGNHPRGIKVRLQDGRIGRVQRMVTGDASTLQPTVTPNAGLESTKYQTEAQVEPQAHHEVPSSLADFVVSRGKKNHRSTQMESEKGSQLAKCPICEDFEGDEAAVSYHVQQHLDQDGEAGG